MSTAVDIENNAALIAATTTKALRRGKRNKHLATRVRDPLYERQALVHRGGQGQLKRAKGQISPPTKEFNK